MEAKAFRMETLSMTTIETVHETTNSSAEKLFDFLSDMNNFEELMPENKIEKWNSESDFCEFTIKGMARIGLKIVNTQRPNLIEITSFGKVPFDFNLSIHINPINESSAELYMIFNGQINAFMKMMVEKPLTNFFNMLVKEGAELNL